MVLVSSSVDVPTGTWKAVPWPLVPACASAFAVVKLVRTVLGVLPTTLPLSVNCVTADGATVPTGEFGEKNSANGFSQHSMDARLQRTVRSTVNVNDVRDLVAMVLE